MKKRGQITIFIIVGLIILVVLSMALYMLKIRTNYLENEVPKQYIIKDNILPVKLYIEECIVNVADSEIKRISMNGGNYYLDSYNSDLSRPQSVESDSFIKYNYENYNYLCKNGLDNTCKHTLLLRQEIEKELEVAIINNLSKCVDLSIFEKQGFVMKTGLKQIKVSISRDYVDIILSYPIYLNNENINLTISDFNSKVYLPLGSLFDLAIEIINEENANGNFDVVNYIYNNGNKIMIEKHKPYPDTVYKLTQDGLVFNFALDGYDKSYEPGVGIVDYNNLQQGCCYNFYDKTCYKNVEEYTCKEKGALFDSNSNCVCPTTDNSNIHSCNGEPCKDCEKTFNYVTGSYINQKKLHGESWCVYDSIAGKGFDYVGSRHYMHYCIDGHEYVSECADFREELCTEESKNIINSQGISQEISKAECRVNRWEDCHTCQTKDCCENTKLRDCDWKPYLSTEIKCVPYVTPGFRFWDGVGTDICSLATQTKECVGLSCPNNWVDDSLVSCYTQGDCGNYRNVNDKLTKGGFYNSDLSDDVRDYVYLKDGLTKSGNNYQINLGIDNIKKPQITDSFTIESKDNFALMISAGLSYFDTLQDGSVTNYLNSNQLNKFKILDVSVCDTWNAPVGGDDCNLCNAHPNRPCSEYKCKSLGSLCEFINLDGVGTCFVKDNNDTTPPIIDFNFETTNKTHKIQKTKLKIDNKIYNGYEITDPLSPYQFLNLDIVTNEATVCKLNFLPRIKYFKFSSFYYGDSKYLTEHNISLKLPKKLIIPKKAYDLFNITSLFELVKFIEDPDRSFNDFVNRYDGQIKYFRQNTGKDLLSSLLKYKDKIKYLTEDTDFTINFYKELFSKILSDFESGKYYLFVECSDLSGNLNKDELFLSFNIIDPGDDYSSPIILGFDPLNNSKLKQDTEEFIFKVYTNEPAECYYDYEDQEINSMQYKFKCSDYRYRTNPKFGGSFECSDIVTMGDQTRLYIKCLDNPRRVFDKSISIAVGTPGVFGTTSSLIGVKNNNSIILPFDQITNELLIAVENQNVSLNLYIDDLLNCSIVSPQFNLERIGFDLCTPTDQLELGHYLCKTNFTLGYNYSENLNVSGSLDQGKLILNLKFKSGDDVINYPGTDINSETIKISYSEFNSFFNDNPAEITIDTVDINFELNIPGDYSCKVKDYIQNITHPLSCFLRSSGKENKSVCYGEFINNNGYGIECIKNAQSQPLLRPINLILTCAETGFSRHNFNNQSQVYEISKSTAPQILDLGPVDEVNYLSQTLYVVTDQPLVKCSYYKDNDLGMVSMQRVNSTYFKADIISKIGENKYSIVCVDKYDNSVETQVNYFVIQ